MVQFAVIYSKKDEAGKNIAKQLKNHFLPQVPIIEFSKDSINLEEIDKDERLKNSEFIIFASRHQSKNQVPSLSLHAPGNWRDADYGGKPGKVCMTSSQALKFLFAKLNENAAQIPELSHQVTLEVTHHGPLISKPCCFIEIGSSMEQWKDKKLGEIIAKTIASFQTFEQNKEIKTAIAIGGPHYCPNFNKIQLNNKKWAISHIIPEYCLPLTESMIKEAIQNTKEQVDLAIIDWKGCGNSESRQQVITLLDKFRLKYERSDNIEK